MDDALIIILISLVFVAYLLVYQFLYLQAQKYEEEDDN